MILQRTADFTDSAPVRQDFLVFLEFAGFLEGLPQNPYSSVEIPDLIAIVMVRTLAAAISETLLDCMVHRQDGGLDTSLITCI